MFNPLKIFHRTTVNTPPETPPQTPIAKSGGRQTKGGIWLSDYEFRVKWQIMEEKMNTVYVFIAVVVIALFACLIGLYFDYKQFQTNSYNEYSQKLKDLNDERYQLQQEQINSLLKTPTPNK